MNTYLAEFVGTAILVLLGNGVVANVVLKKTKGHDSGWMVITAGWGLAVAFAVYSCGRISGAHINPAVTVALASIGDFPWVKVPGYLAAQLIGGAFGSMLVWVVYAPHWEATEDSVGKLACFATVPAIRMPLANMLAEAIGTAMLVFGVLAIGAYNQGPLETNVNEGLVNAFTHFNGPCLVGLLVLSIGLSLGGPTGYAINPARDLGPRIAHAILPIAGKGGSDWRYAWVPIVGPLLGGLLGAFLLS